MAILRLIRSFPLLLYILEPDRGKIKLKLDSQLIERFPSSSFLARPVSLWTFKVGQGRTILL
ncbi:hypothetical protein SESBI_06548 [Sesbania bispinosa]|nr:hypothetical protein SESBI_06548 [Sesbania bispinosa]